MSPASSDPSRRQFLKLFFTGAITSFAGGTMMQSPVLWAAEPTLPRTPGFVRLNLDEYPLFNTPLTTLRISLNPIYGGSEPYPVGFFWPILINRLADSTAEEQPELPPGTKRYLVLDSECTHASCVVDELYVMQHQCRCHGSLYDIEGNVINGPATQPLRRLNFTYDGVNQMVIEVPNLGYHAIPELAAGSRLKLSFFAYPAVNYHVMTRPGFGPGTSWAPVNFSETENGPLTQDAFYGAYAPVSLYVAAPAGPAYFAISADVLQL
jgi:Rieske Fe-S protein